MIKVNDMLLSISVNEFMARPKDNSTGNKLNCTTLPYYDRFNNFAIDGFIL